MKKVFCLLVFSVLIAACSSDNGGGTPTDDVDPGPGPVSFDRAPLLVNWADNIIIPSYEAFGAELTALETAFDTFKANSNGDNLVALRAAWLSSYKSWQRVSMFEIGPAETVGLRLNINTYPTDTEKVDAHVTSGTYDLTLPSNRDAKGFPALDYLINGLGDTDAEIVSKYNAADKEALINYMGALLGDVKTLTNQVTAEWKATYRDTFVANDGASATASVDRFVNDYIFYYEKFLRAGKMGIPLGVFSGSVLPEKVEAYHGSDVSNALFLEGLNAVQDFFNGKKFGENKNTTGESLASYLDALNTVKDGEDLNERINNQFNTARNLVSALAPFKEEIETNAPATAMLLAYDEVQRIVPLLKVDMVSAMSISIDFVDADGD